MKKVICGLAVVILVGSAVGGFYLGRQRAATEEKAMMVYVEKSFARQRAETAHEIAKFEAEMKNIKADTLSLSNKLEVIEVHTMRLRKMVEEANLVAQLCRRGR